MYPGSLVGMHQVPCEQQHKHDIALALVVMHASLKRNVSAFCTSSSHCTLGHAGLNVLALINSHAAAALQYGIERDFTNKTEWVILYDMGATSTEAALVKFSSFVVKEIGKPKTYR